MIYVRLLKRTFICEDEQEGKDQEDQEEEERGDDEFNQRS